MKYSLASEDEKTMNIKVPVTEETLTKIKEIARQKGVSYKTLAISVLEEFLEK